MRLYKKINIALEGSHKYIMSFDVKKGDSNVVKEYIGYDSIDEYDGRDNMYEIIRGRQRLYFDVDSDINLDDEVREFIEHCRSIYHVVNINATNNELNHHDNNYRDSNVDDIVCYTSHREGKYSYHIVLQNVYARDNVQCKYYCQSLLEGMSLKPYVDMKVYKDIQHFRLMGCSKISINNKKIPWLGKPRTLEDSLITYWREGSTLLDYCKQLEYCNMAKSAYELKHSKKTNVMMK